MSCHVERGYGNLTPCGSTLWVRVKRHAIHHCGSSMHRRLIENILLIVTNLCNVSQYSISLRTYHSMTSWCMSLISVDLNVVYWSVLHLILDSAWVWYSLLPELKIPTLAWHWDCLLCLRCWEAYSPHREATTLWVWTMRCIGIVRTMAIFIRLICPRTLWWDVSVLWGQYLHHRHCDLGSYTWSDGVHLIVPEETLVISRRTILFLRRLWSTLWIGYYSGRKTSAIQLYLADLHWQRRTEHSILHWSLKLWDAISMWKADLEKERCVLTMFCIQKKVVQIPCVNHFVLEKLISLWLMSWLFTVGWEPVWFENFWKCFDVFEFILWKVSFVDL